VKEGGRRTKEGRGVKNRGETGAALSENGKIAFGQRNLLYGIRPGVEEARRGKKIDYDYFCRILTDYENEKGDIPNLVRDSRGSINDTRGETPLGTTPVAIYEREPWLFHKVLFCEKEDHKQILLQVGWPQRHDCAVISSKGFASRAARDWIDKVADTGEPVIVFCIHDADAAGTMIAQTLQEATRARGRRRIEIVDVGLQPWVAREMGLPIENVSYEKPQPVADYVKSRPDGPCWEAWLQTHRIELNAMSPRQMIDWITAHVEAHGELKLVPPPDVAEQRLYRHIEMEIERQETERVLAEAHARIRAETQRRVAEVRARLPDGDVMVGDLREAVARERERHWSQVVDRFAVRVAQASAEEDTLQDEKLSARDSTKH